MHGAAALRPSAGADGRGTSCDLVTVPARQGLEAVDILRRGGAECVGPVLHDGACDTLGFLVPSGTADAWDLPGSACTQSIRRGTYPVTTHLGGGASHTVEAGGEGTGWLLPPDGADPVTDPTLLRAALGEAARTIEAADTCW